MNQNKESSGLTCPLTGCPIWKVLLATVVTFAVTFGFDWLFHGNYMKADYEATASLWRPEAEMQQLLQWCLVYHGVLAFSVAALYCWISRISSCNGTCQKTGLKFGLLVGLIIGITHFGGYLWMPIPMEMALKWLSGTILWGLLVGLALSLTCRACKSSCSKDAK